MKYKIIAVIFSITVFQTTLFGLSSEKIGDVLRLVIPVSAYATTLYLDDKEGQYQFYKSFGTNVLVTYGLKYTIDRQRPNGEEHSFPSGHTSMAFQGATFIQMRYGLEYSLLAYLGAVYVGYSRVESDNHYIGDVVAGAIIGSLSSYFFTSKYQIEPITASKTYGMKLSMKF